MVRLNSISILFVAISVWGSVARGAALDNLGRGTPVNDSTLDGLATTSVPYAVARCHSGMGCDVDDVDVTAFTNFGSGNLFYSLGADIKLRSFSVQPDQFIGSWGLNGGYNELIQLRGEYSIGEEEQAGTIADSVAHGSDLVVRDKAGFGTYEPYDTAHGCLEVYPLRYGDIFGDGKTELVLNLASDWLIFSPDLHKVTFAGRWEIEDVLAEKRVQWFGWSHDAPDAPQYVAESGTVKAVNEVLPARRSYAKFYVGDFDLNGKPDILMWRKAYQSRLNNDPLKGYEKIGEALVQYERGDDGIYAPTKASSDTVKGWLTVKGLTWQDGYPNVSECPGEEGKPIPEMVDPLLNDPDVLKTSTTTP